MALSLPVENILKTKSGQIVGGHTTIGPSSYRSAESSQNEIFKFGSFITNTYIEIYTVTTGKTFYVTSIIMSLDANGQDGVLATGAAASEVDFMLLNGTTEQLTHSIILNTPLKFSSGTRISVRGKETNNGGDVTLIGFEE